MDFSKSSSPIARDLKLNFKKFSSDSTLSPTEAAMVSLAVAKAVDFPLLQEWATETLTGLGVEQALILEAEESAALMGMLNSYYKFRGFISKSEPEVASEQYNQAGLRMTALARPQIGKENFELLALVVSVVNGCATCVTSHERVLRESGVPPSKIHDAVRLAASIKGLSKLS
jgi:lipoyl-dependent peroxiredoxin subunit D